MWTEDAPTFQGKYYTINAPINKPHGVRKPHPSFWIGGGGERVTLKLVAKWADACNITADPETLRHKLDVLREHCEALGRDYNSITRSTSLEDIVLLKPGEDPEAATARERQTLGMSFEDYAKRARIGTIDETVERIQRYVDAGANYILVSFPRIAYDHEPLYRFAEEVAPRIRS
jgi:alkanesulfonate monooxygenase SsuD/methylene tetrahydromethanopterin reductase-like flavin-dependent oxidoreductase (luciferase family)